MYLQKTWVDLEMLEVFRSFGELQPMYTQSQMTPPLIENQPPINRMPMIRVYLSNNSALPPLGKPVYADLERHSR